MKLGIGPGHAAGIDIGATCLTGVDMGAAHVTCVDWLVQGLQTASLRGVEAATGLLIKSSNPILLTDLPLP